MNFRPNITDINSFVYKMLRKNGLCLMPLICSKTKLLYLIKAGPIRFASAKGHKKLILEVFVSFSGVLAYGIAGPLSSPIICKTVYQNKIVY